MKILFIAFFLFASVVGLMFYRMTSALYSNSASSTDNTFAAAAEFPTTTLTPTPTPDLTNIADHIVISEVQIATSGASTSDFIEIYNPTSSPINLDPFKLVKRASTGTETDIEVFTSGDSIPAHGYYLWANSSSGYSEQLNADENSADTLSANNSIAIKLDSDDSIIDALAWGTGTSQLIEGTAFSTDPPDNQSIERKALTTSTQPTMEGGSDATKGNGFDAGNNATDFILRTVSQLQNSLSATEAP